METYHSSEVYSKVSSFSEIDAALVRYHLSEQANPLGKSIEFKASDRVSKENVRVRLYPLKMLNKKDALLNRAMQWVQLNHPCLERVYDFGIAKEFFFVVTEEIEGDKLDVLIKDGHLDHTTIVSVAKNLSRGLAFTQDRGLVHGSVFASNVIIGEYGIKLANSDLFGLEAFSSEEKKNRLICYAPETLNLGLSDHRSDIYCFGAILMKCLTGLFPNEFSEAAHPPIGRLGGLRNIIFRCIHAAADRRYSNFRELERDLSLRLTAA